MTDTQTIIHRVWR